MMEVNRTRKRSNDNNNNTILSCEGINHALQRVMMDDVICREVDNGILMHLPLLTPSNDSLEIFVAFDPVSRTLSITDLGQTLDELNIHGIPAAGIRKRKNVMRLLQQEGISLDGDFLHRELKINSRETQDLEDLLSNELRRFIQSMLTLMGLTLTGRFKLEKGKFLDEVYNYLAEKHVLFDSEPTITGESGRTYQPDFQLINPKTDTAEALMVALGDTEQIKRRVDAVFVMWQDTPTQFQRVSVLDDKIEWPKSEITLLQKTSTTFMWEEQREQFNKFLEPYMIIESGR